MLEEQEWQSQGADAPIPKPPPAPKPVLGLNVPKNIPASPPFSKAHTGIPQNPQVTHILKAKPIAQTIVHRPQVTVDQTRVAQSLGTGMGQCPQSLPQPFPPIPLDLQRLLVASKAPKPNATPQRVAAPQIPPQNKVKYYQPPAKPQKHLPFDLDSDFVKQARIPSFDVKAVPFLRKHESCNEDLFLGSFTKSNLIWAGSQKKGTPPAFAAESYLDHIDQALKQDFPLSSPIPLPPEVIASLDWISTTDPKAVMAFWREQLSSLTRLVTAAAPIQASWASSVPTELLGAQPRFCSVAFHQLLHHFGLGGDRWISQFIFGFPTVGSFSQEGVFPLSEKHPAPAPVATLWRSSVKRFMERSRASGFRFSQELWDEAMEQVSSGWLSEPLPFTEEGDTPFFSLGASNAAFRFAVVQDRKLRPCDDLRHNLTNVCTAILTPITLPTWDHLSEIAKAVYSTSRDWSFIKGDHASAYKQLPLDPTHANLTVVALRHPVTNRWMAFVPKVLLFGSISAVLHYNCFSRCLAVLMNRCFGIPMVSYFDDFGSFIPRELAQAALDTFSGSLAILGSDLNNDKSGLGSELNFLGLTGNFPQVSSGMLLRIFLPEDKILTWSAQIDEFTRAGSISHKQLEKLVGRLSFTQTSVFGRFGRTLLRPLHRKLHQHPFQERFSSDEMSLLAWWAASIRAARPRVVHLKSNFPEVVIYTDAATSTCIIAAVIIDVKNFSKFPAFEAVLSEQADATWADSFSETNLIYGLEMLAVIATMFVLRDFLAGRNVVFYVDNLNTKDALVKGHSDSPAIDKLIKIFWAFAQSSGAWVWIEHVPGTRNIADLPTRNVALPLPHKFSSAFGILNILSKWVTKDSLATEYFQFYGTPNTGRK